MQQQTGGPIWYSNNNWSKIWTGKANLCNCWAILRHHCDIARAMLCNWWLYLMSQQTSWEVCLCEKIVIPLISDSIVSITTAAKILSPVSGIKFVHDHKECKRKQEFLSTKSSILSSGEELIVHHMKDSQQNSQKEKRTPASKWQRNQSCLHQSNWKQR